MSSLICVYMLVFRLYVSIPEMYLMLRCSIVYAMYTAWLYCNFFMML